MKARTRPIVSVVLGMVVALGLGTILLRVASGPEDHAARVLLYVAPDSSPHDEDAWILSDDDLGHCADAISDPAIAREVVDALDLDVAPSALLERVQVERRDETALLTVTAHDPSPSQALLIADAYGSIARERLGWPRRGACAAGNRRVLLTVTDPAALVAD